MNEAVLMCLIERRCHLEGVFEEMRRRQGAFRQTRFQRFAFQPFHDKKVDAVRRADVVNRADVWMIQAGCGARLTLKALPQVLAPLSDARAES